MENLTVLIANSYIISNEYKITSTTMCFLNRNLVCTKQWNSSKIDTTGEVALVCYKEVRCLNSLFRVFKMF